MDFLDPRTKKSRKRRLLISYALMAILVVASAFVLLYSSLGYGINTQTGQIVQNGLVFIDSKPVAANISINGKPNDHKTSARLVLAAGKYALSLSKEGYRSWSTTLKISPQDVWRLPYPLMIPAKLSTAKVATTKSPAFIDQTPDRHWLLVANQASGLAVSQLDTTKPADGLKPLSLPKALTGFSGQFWGVTSWSRDGSQLLLKHSNSSAKTEFIVINRTKPSQSYNLSALVKGRINQASFLPNDSNKLYALLQTGDLLGFDSASKTSTKLLNGVQASNFWATGNHIIYAVNGANRRVIYLWDGSKTYQLAAFTNSPLSVSAANYQGQEYYVVSDGSYDYIYKNPLPTLQSGAAAKPLVQAKAAGGYTSFSPDHHLLVMGSGQDYSTYNLETSSLSTFKVKTALTGSPEWIDNYHLGARTVGGKGLLLDFNGQNQQIILPSWLSNGEFISADFKTIYTQIGSASSAVLSSASLLLH